MTKEQLNFINFKLKGYRLLIKSHTLGKDAFKFFEVAYQL